MHPVLTELRRLLLYLTLWVPVAGLLVGLLRLSNIAELVLIPVPLSVVFAFMCLSAWYICRAFPLKQQSFPRIVVLAGGTAAVTSSLWVLLANAWVVVLNEAVGVSVLDDRFASAIPLLFGLGFVIYVVSVVGHYLFIAFEASGEAEKAALEARILAREVELKVLKAQIDPHFLFNSLNSVSSLIGSDPSGARKMCLMLAEFLRESLRYVNADDISLANEVALVEKFLRIEQVRFGERLGTDIRIDPDLTSSRVPPLLLQPLVENAVKHGIAHLIEGGTVHLAASRVGDDLKLVVENDCDPERPTPSKTGIGLENVRGRIDVLFDGRARVDVEARPDRFVVQIRIPYLAEKSGESSAPSAVGKEAGA